MSRLPLCVIYGSELVPSSPPPHITRQYPFNLLPSLCRENLFNSTCVCFLNMVHNCYYSSWYVVMCCVLCFSRVQLVCTFAWWKYTTNDAKICPLKYSVSISCSDDHLGVLDYLSLQGFFNITQLVRHKQRGLRLHAKLEKSPSPTPRSWIRC